MLTDLRKLWMWCLRVTEMQQILNQLDVLAVAVPGLSGRLNQSRIAVAGHSFTGPPQPPQPPHSTPTSTWTAATRLWATARLVSLKLTS